MDTIETIMKELVLQQQKIIRWWDEFNSRFPQGGEPYQGPSDRTCLEWLLSMNVPERYNAELTSNHEFVVLSGTKDEIYSILAEMGLSEVKTEHLVEDVVSFVPMGWVHKFVTYICDPKEPNRRFSIKFSPVKLLGMKA